MGRYISFWNNIWTWSHPTSIDEGTTVVIISGMNVYNFKSCPLNTLRNPIWWLISKPYFHIEISNSLPIYRGHNSQIGRFQFSSMDSRTNNLPMTARSLYLTAVYLNITDNQHQWYFNLWTSWKNCCLSATEFYELLSLGWQLQSKKTHQKSKQRGVAFSSIILYCVLKSIFELISYMAEIARKRIILCIQIFFNTLQWAPINSWEKDSTTMTDTKTYILRGLV